MAGNATQTVEAHATKLPTVLGGILTYVDYQAKQRKLLEYAMKDAVYQKELGRWLQTIGKTSNQAKTFRALAAKKAAGAAIAEHSLSTLSRRLTRGGVALSVIGTVADCFVDIARKDEKSYWSHLVSIGPQIGMSLFLPTAALNGIMSLILGSDWTVKIVLAIAHPFRVLMNPSPVVTKAIDRQKRFDDSKETAGQPQKRYPHLYVRTKTPVWSLPELGRLYFGLVNQAYMWRQAGWSEERVLREVKGVVESGWRIDYDRTFTKEAKQVVARAASRKYIKK